MEYDLMKVFHLDKMSRESQNDFYKYLHKTSTNGQDIPWKIDLSDKSYVTLNEWLFEKDGKNGEEILIKFYE